jgi:hypothetical protein
MRNNPVDILFTVGFLTINLFIVLLVPSVFLEKNLKNPCPNKSISENIQKYLFINTKNSRVLFTICFIVYGICFLSHLILTRIQDNFPLFNVITMIAASLCLFSSLIYWAVLNLSKKPTLSPQQVTLVTAAAAPPPTAAAPPQPASIAAQQVENEEIPNKTDCESCVNWPDDNNIMPIWSIPEQKCIEYENGSGKLYRENTERHKGEYVIINTTEVFWRGEKSKSEGCNQSASKAKISVGANGQVWRVDEEQALWCCLSHCDGEWTKVATPGGKKILSVSCGKSFVYIITEGTGGTEVADLSSPWKKASDNTGIWMRLDNRDNFNQISSSPNDEVYGIKIDKNIYKLKPQFWDDITSSDAGLTGKAEEIFVGPDDIWVKSSAAREFSDGLLSNYLKRSIVDTASVWEVLPMNNTSFTWIGSPSISNDGKYFWGLRGTSQPYISGTDIDNGPTKIADSENTSKFIALSAGRQETWGIKEDKTIWKTSVDNTSEPNYWVPEKTKTLSRATICSTDKGINNYIKYHRNIIIVRTLSILSGIVIVLNYDYGLISMILR